MLNEFFLLLPAIPEGNAGSKAQSHAKTAAQTSLCLWTDTGALVPFICGVQEEEKGVPADLISLHLYEFQKALGNPRFLDPVPFSRFLLQTPPAGGMRKEVPFSRLNEVHMRLLELELTLQPQDLHFASDRFLLPRETACWGMLLFSKLLCPGWNVREILDVLMSGYNNTYMVCPLNIITSVKQSARPPVALSKSEGLFTIVCDSLFQAPFSGLWLFLAWHTFMLAPSEMVIVPDRL